MGVRELTASLLSKANTGTAHDDTMNHILDVCEDIGIAYTTVHKADGTKFRDLNLGKARVDELPTADRYLFEALNTKITRQFLKHSQEFALRLNVPAVRTGVDGNLLYVEVPRPGRSGPVLFDDVYARQAKGRVLLGRLADSDAPLWLDMGRPENPHAALIGTTGSGKTTLARTMALSGRRNGAALALFDPKGGLWPLAGMPGIFGGGLFRRPVDCEVGLAALVQRMDDVDAGRVPPVTVLAFIDEVPTLIAQRPRAKEHLARLAMAGRHADIHLVVIAQHVLSSELGSATMRNLPVRIVGRVTDATAAYQAKGVGHSNAQALQGAGTFIVGDYQFRAAMIPDRALAAVARKWPPRMADALPLPEAEPVVVGAGPGRPPEETPDEIIAAIKAYHTQNGKWPRNRWIRDRWGMGYDRAGRVLEEAKYG